ncbi:atrophin-1 [Striga asiatica]|uniref:Atrophin-1 n=1 Tax=Striga asiatica TaxID=4170 RepID=A0A5A7QK73_STRAF|nr:atrophin-1 [Striga asiatica]
MANLSLLITCLALFSLVSNFCFGLNPNDWGQGWRPGSGSPPSMGWGLGSPSGFGSGMPPSGSGSPPGYGSGSPPGYGSGSPPSGSGSPPGYGSGSPPSGVECNYNSGENVASGVDVSSNSN